MGEDGSGKILPSFDHIETLVDTEFYIGCNICSKNTIPIVTYDTTFGTYIQDCEPVTNYDLTVENAPCPQSGEILRWNGYFIEEE